MVAELPDGWSRCTLAEAATWYSGGTPATTEAAYWNGDIPWISAASLTRFHITDSSRRVTELGAQSGTRVVDAGTILCVVRGMSLKTQFRVGIATRRVAFGQDCKALVACPGIHPVYLAYALRAREAHILGMVDEAGHGTGRIQTDRLQALDVPLPPPKEQRAIAEVLGALDDKIDANTRLARLCDDLWLVLATSALDAAAKATGPTAPLTSLATFVNGRAFTKSATGTGRMVVRIAELNSGPGGSTVYNDLDVPEQHLARPGDLLFAWSGSLTVRRWFRDEGIVNQHIFKVMPETGVPMWLVHAHLLRLLDQFRAIAADKATTMGHIQRRHLEVQVPVLAGDALAELDHCCDPLWQRALAAERESLVLATLRDTLLPPLISGELRVRDAEAVAEAVT